MRNIVSFMIMMETVYRAAGVLTNKTTTSVCQGLTAAIDFSINLQGSTSGTGSESWYFGSTQIATNPSGTFSPQGNYSSRLSSYSTYGISLSGVTSTDAGEYLLVFAVIAPTPMGVTATASLTVNIAPASSCVPYYSLTGGTYKCVLNQTAVSNNECGSPILQTNWTNGLGTSDITNIATSGNYTCCAYGIAKNCYSGSYTFCETFSITVKPDQDRRKWWCKCDWCIGLGVASGGLLVFSVVIGIIIFCKKQKDIENHMIWQISTITIAVVVVIIIVVTGVLAGIVCLCWSHSPN